MKQLLAVLIVVLLTSFALSQPVYAQEECWVYDVEIQGSLEGYNFQRQGRLVVLPFQLIESTGTRSPANQWEFWLQSGQPWASPSRGSILFVTNSFFTDGGNYGRAMIQMADITWNNDGGYYIVEPNMYESQNVLNAFNINTGVTAGANIITAGGMGIGFSEDFSQVFARIEFLGRNWMTPGSRASLSYIADIEGTFAGYGSNADCFPANF